MTHPRACRSSPARALAAAGLVMLGGCAHPRTSTTATAASSSAGSSPALSSAPSTPGPTGSSASDAAATTRAAAAAPGSPAAAASTTPYPRGRAGTPFGGLPAASTRTSPYPLVVTTAALRVFYGSDTTLDAQPMDAEKRALPWLGGPFAAAVRSAATVAAPGAVWNGWAAHRAHLVVTVARGYDDGAPPDTATAVHRQWLITQTPVGTGPGTTRWTGTPVRTVFYTTSTRAGGRWAVTAVQEAP